MTNYNPNCPSPPDIPRDSQDEFLLNFTTLNSLYGSDHLPFTNNDPNNGFHKQVRLQNTVTPPNQPANRSSVFSNKPNGPIDLFYQNSSISTDLDNLTNSILTSANNAIGFTSPWGIIFNHCPIQKVRMGNVPVTIPFSVPYTSKVFFVLVQLVKDAFRAPLTLVVPSATITGFDIRINEPVSVRGDVFFYYFSAGI